MRAGTWLIMMFASLFKTRSEPKSFKFSTTVSSVGEDMLNSSCIPRRLEGSGWAASSKRYGCRRPVSTRSSGNTTSIKRRNCRSSRCASVTRKTSLAFERREGSTETAMQSFDTAERRVELGGDPRMVSVDVASCSIRYCPALNQRSKCQIQPEMKNPKDRLLSLTNERRAILYRNSDGAPATRKSICDSL